MCARSNSLSRLLRETENAALMWFRFSGPTLAAQRPAAERPRFSAVRSSRWLAGQVARSSALDAVLPVARFPSAVGHGNNFVGPSLFDIPQRKEIAA